MSVIHLRRWPYPRSLAERLAVVREYSLTCTERGLQLTPLAEQSLLPDRINGWFTEVDGVDAGLLRDESGSFWFFHSESCIRLDSDTQCNIGLHYLRIRFELVRDGKTRLFIHFGSRAKILWDRLADFFDANSWTEAEALFELASAMKTRDGLTRMIESLQKGSGAFELV